MELEDSLKVFLASSPNTYYPIQIVVIKHSSFGILGFWKEGVVYNNWVLEDGTVVNLESSNLEVKLASSENDLDQKIDIALDVTDSEDRVRNILDSIPLYSEEKILVEYREYMSNEFTRYKAVAKASLQIEGLSYESGLCAISAVIPRLNNKKTGRTYNIRTFPTLRGFLP